MYKRVVSTFKSAEKKRIIHQCYLKQEGYGYLFCTEDHPFWADRLIEHKIDENGVETLVHEPEGWTPALELEGTECHSLRTFDNDVAYVSTFEDNIKALGIAYPDPDCQIVLLCNPSDTAGLIDFSAGRPVIVDNDTLGPLLPTEECSNNFMTEKSRVMSERFHFDEMGYYQHYHDYVYNIEVEDYHTYFVGATGIWVHNCGGAAGRECITRQLSLQHIQTLLPAAKQYWLDAGASS